MTADTTTISALLGVIATLAGVIVYMFKSNDAKHVAEIARKDADADKHIAILNKVSAALNEYTLTAAARNEAQRDMARVVERAVDAFDKARSGARFPAVRPEERP